jgi:hypothetical protein
MYLRAERCSGQHTYYYHNVRFMELKEVRPELIRANGKRALTRPRLRRLVGMRFDGLKVCKTVSLG